LTKLMDKGVYIDDIKTLASASSNRKRLKNLRQIISGSIRSRHSFEQVREMILQGPECRN